MRKVLDIDKHIFNERNQNYTHLYFNCIKCNVLVFLNFNDVEFYYSPNETEYNCKIKQNENIIKNIIE
jgi:hypothetical protein